MSNDQIFAAQMWSWADPMIKRDSHGRILIVNAAFLQLYGGTIESWTGNPIQGWPLPQPVGEVAKFESRIPQPTGGETVYDWMECMMADGTALAMARDVSVYAQMPIPQPVIQPTEQYAPATPSQEPNLPQAQPTQAEVSADLASLSPAHQFSAPVQPAQEPAPAVAPQPVAEVQPTPQPEPVAPAPTSAQAPQNQQAESHPVVAPLPLENIPPAQPVAQQQTVQEPEARDFERRALPIENGDAILGNNWRDAVIAKAVGVEDSAEAPVAPAAQAQSRPNAPTTSSQPPSDKIRVLLAEDNAINALLTRTLLEAEGCLCDVVEDGVLAVEAIKNNDYKMIFMDMRMPNMDGLEATRKIRSMGYGADVLPIVALTANAFDDDRNACFDSGMNDFMTKPVSAEELSAMVTSHTTPKVEKMAS